MTNENYEAAKLVYNEVTSIGKGINSDKLFICVNNADERLLVKVNDDKTTTETDITPRQCKTKEGVDCVKKYKLYYTCLVLEYYNSIVIIDRFTSNIVVFEKDTKDMDIFKMSNNYIDIFFIEHPCKNYRMKKKSLMFGYECDNDAPVKTGYVIDRHTGKVLKVLEGVTDIYTNQKHIDFAVVYRYGDESDYSDELKRYCIRYKDADIITVQDVIETYGFSYDEDENEADENNSDERSYTYITDQNGDSGCIHNITLEVVI